MVDGRHHEQKAAAINSGYRQTAQRAVILAEVKAAEGHLTAGEIFERVRRKDPRIAYGTVYRSLHLLARHGLIQELTFADQASRYDGRVDRHDHVSCTGCGLLVDVDVPVALIARHVAEERSGFAIASHHTVFAGRCPSCRRTGGQTDGRTEESRGSHRSF
jgi:Fur family transcriptional regulator, peroxide stress response regulator